MRTSRDPHRSPEADPTSVKGGWHKAPAGQVLPHLRLFPGAVVPGTTDDFNRCPPVGFNDYRTLRGPGPGLCELDGRREGWLGDANAPKSVRISVNDVLGWTGLG